MEQFGMEVPLPEKSYNEAAAADLFKLYAPTRGHPDTIFRQLKEGKSSIKMLYSHGGYFLLSMANTKDVFAGLLNLEFLSVADTGSTLFIRGMDDKAIRAMIQENPARLLGLDAEDTLKN
jgi:hypothetical protein